MYHSLKEAKKYLDPKQFRGIHQQALVVVKEFKTKETELIKIIQEVDKNKVYRFIGCNSLFQYLLAIGLSESQAQIYTTVARKSLECPELQKAVENQEITITKAKRICSVIDTKNQLQWIDMARTFSSRELEKAVAKVNPKAAHPESARYINDHTLELKINISEDTFKMLEMVKAMVSRKKNFSFDSDQALAEVLNFYLDRNDPYRKALRRHEARTKDKTNGKKMNKIEPTQNLNKSSKEAKTFDDAGNKNVHVHESSLKISQVISKNSQKVTKHLDDQIDLNTNLINEKDAKNTKTVKAAKPVSNINNTGNTYNAHNTENLNNAEAGNFRKAIPNKLKYKVYLRDQGKCQYQDQSHKKCNEFRWIDIHHKLPVSQGGQDQLDNLVTLCKPHHRLIHDK